MISFSELAGVVARETGMDADELTPHSSFVDLPIDSLEKVALIQELEEALGCEILDDDLAKLVTLGNVLDYINHTRSLRS